MLANDVVVPGLPVAEVGPDDEHVAGVPKRKVRLVLEADAEAQRSVIDGLGDEVHDLAVDFGIRFAKLLLALLDVLVNALCVPRR